MQQVPLNVWHTNYIVSDPTGWLFRFCGRKNIKSHDHTLFTEEHNDNNLLLIIQTLWYKTQNICCGPKGKCKAVHVNVMKAYKRNIGTALNGHERSVSHPREFTSAKRAPSTH
jgi:hypothetical protein